MSALPETKTIHTMSGFEKQLNHGYRRDMMALFILLALAGVVVMGFAHRYGPWVDAKAVENIAAARNLAWSIGLKIPAADGSLLPYGFQPPLYTLLLSVIFFLGLDLFLVISIFNVLLFAGILFLLSWGLWRTTNSILMAIGIAVLFAMTPFLVMNFDSATSYGLLTFLVVANLISLISYFQTEDRRPYLLALFTAMLAFFTDFIGGACILTGALVILLFGKKKFRRKLLFAAVYAFGAALPMILWQIIHLIQRTQPEMRTLMISMSFKDAVLTYLHQLLNLFVQWLPAQPGWISRWLQTREAFFTIGIVSLLFYAVTLWQFLRKQDERLRQWVVLLTICLVFIVTALGIIFGESYLQTRNAPELTIVMLAPLYPFLIIFIFGCMLALVQNLRIPAYTLAVPVVLGAIFIFANYQPTIQYVYSRYRSGSTYTTPQWQNSELLVTVNSISALRTYFTNDPSGVLLYHVGSAPYDISYFDYSIPFLEQNDAMTQLFKERMGMLLLFQPAYMNPETGENEVIDYSTFAEGLELVYRGTDGEIYFPPIPEK